MFAGLSLDQAPPFKAPLKFFLTAPIFAFLCALIILFNNSLDLYSYKTIAIVHLFTIGFILMVIFGALQQMLPVVAGAVIKKPLVIANLTYYLLSGGIFLFFIGFYFYNKIILMLSSLLILFSTTLFLGVCIYELIKVKNKSMIIQGILISLLFAFLAIFIGIHLEVSHGLNKLNNYYFIYTTMHYNFIFFGFLFLLIVSITFQVVPMFWVTNPFKKSVQKFLIYSTTFLLFIYCITLIFEFDYSLIYKLLILFLTSYFAFETIKAINSRKRKLKDLSVYYYITSMLFLCIGSIYFLFYSFLNLKIETLGVLWGIGFVASIMNGMLYKIVPFLAWFHLSSKGFFDIPTIRDMIPLKHIEIQFYFHLTSIILFVVYFFIEMNIILKLASIFFIISNIYLFFNLYKAAKVYLDFDTSQN